MLQRQYTCFVQNASHISQYKNRFEYCDYKWLVTIRGFPVTMIAYFQL